MKKISFLIIGDEIVTGEKKDSNIANAQKLLKEFDVETICINSCIDDTSIIANQLKLLADKSDFIITSGGLGPTTDDKTREALSIFAHKELEFHNKNWLEKKEFFTKKFNRVFPETNRIQYFLPKDFLWLENPNATADAIKYETDKFCLYSLAGVPNEFSFVFENFILKDIKAKVSKKQQEILNLKFYGIGESTLAEIWTDIGLSDSHNIKTAYLPSIETGLSVNVFFDVPFTKNSILKKIEKSILNNHLVSTNGENIEAVIIKNLIKKNISIALAESCTGGLIANMLSNVQGASSALKCSVVAYNKELKEKLLAIDNDFFQKYSVVSRECSQIMANNIKNISSADITASVTGYLGHKGGDETSENGTVWISVCHKDEINSFSMKVDPQDRREINKQRVANRLLLEILAIAK